MSRIDELVFLHQDSTSCHLAVLAESIGLKTRVVKQVADLEPERDHNCFYLIAQKGAALDSKGVPLIVARLLPHVPIALYQIERGSLDPESALLLGVRGLLFADQRMDLLLTGLRKMVNDELWFDRPLISKVFRRLVNRQDSGVELTQDTVTMLQMLTGRERTVIQLVSSGARNKEIADKLCISEHTVKAHISSIFRKTQSRNRVELLRWSQANACHFEICS
ncbi:response regulator transcription factor [Shewanella colwelliana]|uniref:Helix-turn-helix transcriptional regulator n=1 Tax=Shewanella colwelliana TaxID=23 RepID=A0A1E5IVU2_SHECO|nr:LuxR C-terminal-related transcriptional regulator [Shewanella colwelliana]MCZ4335873.1 LuxR C-terminal-related transcriptional regulator [Shewanella colwelliana]OEG74198.1 helix-turn-helix transcriptional regulator [Shewanella colwelliana]